MNRTEQVACVLENLHRQYPDAECTLSFGAPYQLLVAAILAAQCTDVRVNIITRQFFSHYPDLPSLASASLAAIEDDIRSCGLFHNKARSISAASQMLLNEYGGEMPADRDRLLALPGVGRKIANLILGDCFGVPAIVVDTHCLRISKLIGLTENTDPLKVERDLTAILPESEWTAYGHLVVTHGREICIARRPQCGRCPILPCCRYGSGLDAVALAQSVCAAPNAKSAAAPAAKSGAMPAAKSATPATSSAAASAAKPGELIASDNQAKGGRGKRSHA